MPGYVHKGVRVRVRWLSAKPPGSYSLAGAQMKVAAEEVEVIGRVVHLRGDNPVNPAVVRLYVLPENDVPAWVPRTVAYGCEHPEHQGTIEIRPEWVVGVQTISQEPS